MTCLICKFWKADPTSKNMGSCLRFPPQVVAVPETLPANENAGRYSDEVVSKLESHWPTTRCNDWCGEYTPKY